MACLSVRVSVLQGELGMGMQRKASRKDPRPWAHSLPHSPQRRPIPCTPQVPGTLGLPGCAGRLGAWRLYTTWGWARSGRAGTPSRGSMKKSSLESWNTPFWEDTSGHTERAGPPRPFRPCPAVTLGTRGLCSRCALRLGRSQPEASGLTRLLYAPTYPPLTGRHRLPCGPGQAVPWPPGHSAPPLGMPTATWTCWCLAPGPPRRGYLTPLRKRGSAVF